VIIQSPQNQSVCEGGTVNFTCVVMFPNGSTPGGAGWFYNNRANDAEDLASHFATNDVAGRSAPANITNVLTITNADFSNNRRDYVCVQGAGIAVSNISFLTVLGKLVKCFCICMCFYVCVAVLYNVAC